MWSPIVKGMATSIWSSGNPYFDIVRSVQTASQISFGGLGAIIGTVIFRAQDAPRFIPGESKESPDPYRALTRHIRPQCHPCFPDSLAHGPACDCVAFCSNEQTHERRQTGKPSWRPGWILLHAMRTHPYTPYISFLAISTGFQDTNLSTAQVWRERWWRPLSAIGRCCIPRNYVTASWSV